MRIAEAKRKASELRGLLDQPSCPPTLPASDLSLDADYIWVVRP